MKVIDYLKKQEEEINNERLQKIEDLELINSKIKENEKFYELLDEEQTHAFTEFSPRDINQKNVDKMKEISKMIESLTEDKASLEERIQKLDNNLEELKELIGEIDINVSTDGSIESDENIGISKKKLVNSLENILSFVAVDSTRASIEIRQLLKEINI